MEPNWINITEVILCSLIFFSGNLLCQFISKRKVNSNFEYSESLNVSFAGIMLGFGLNLIQEIELVNEIAFYTGRIMLGITILSFLSGVMIFLFSRDKSRIKNSFFMLSGLFCTDKNESSLNNLFQILSRFSWELPQTLLGYIFAQMMNCIGRVGDVQFIAGATYCLYNVKSNRRQGVSIGNYIYVRLISRELIFDKDPLLLHEYGHHLQSRKFGWLYLFIIGIPSLISALSAKPLPGGITTHDLQWYEMQANRYAAAYLYKNFQSDWTQFEPPLNSFPRTRIRDLI